jgi:hypothetical protein
MKTFLLRDAEQRHHNARGRFCAPLLSPSVASHVTAMVIGWQLGGCIKGKEVFLTSCVTSVLPRNALLHKVSVQKYK